MKGETVETITDSTSILFHQSQSHLDLDLGNNRKELERMLDNLKRNTSDTSSYKLGTIRVEGGASPEGTVSINDRLSRQRADNIFNYFRERVNLPHIPTEFKSDGRDWRGLYLLVTKDTRVPYRQDVLQLLQPAVEAESLSPEESDLLLSNLKALHSGLPYDYMFSRLFPDLRESRLYVEFNKYIPDTIPDTISVEPPYTEPDTLPIVLETIVEIPVETKECKPFYMGVKTNLLYDALTIPSIGIEFYLGKNWSVAGNWNYGWWDKDRTHRYWRAYGGDISVRKWFGSAAENKPLTGHHIGLYTGIFTYDFEFGGIGHMGGRPGHSLWDRCMFTAGIEYGYSLPIARRLNLDFTLGVGYLTGKVVKYHPKNGFYVWDSTKRINTVMPTKLEVSLVWLIGCDNYNRK